MTTPTVASVDFETFGIEPRPDYPPEPVGVSIIEPRRKPKYYAWGHPVENNCTKAQARRELARIYKTYPVLFHNAKFDLDVGNTHLELPLIPKHGYHDTEYLAFLHNPHAMRLSLKPLSYELLGMPPEEQDQVRDWILSHVWLSNKFSDGGYEIKIDPQKPKGWYKVPPTKSGAFIAYAPGKLVGKYANSDTDRTLKLFKYYWKSVIEEYGMLDAYMREIRLMPILLASERAGLRINESRLRKDSLTWTEWVLDIDAWIRRRLKAKDLNVDSENDFADALEHAGKVDEWVYTEKGNRSVSKENLAIACTDVQLLKVYNYRTILTTSLRNFARPWLGMANRNEGFISTNWNQVRQTDERGKGKRGARTGRLSSNPNFQNIPKQPTKIILPAALSKKGLGDVPFMRSYITSDGRGNVLLNRDYSQQELRILGHFEDAVLLQAYQKNPKMDIHDEATRMIIEMLGSRYIKQMFNTVDHKIIRRPIKNMGFGLIYGMGIMLLADNMGVEPDVAKKIKAAYLRIFPGLKALDDDLKHRGRMGEYIRTWGGRCYYVEPPMIMDNGKVRTFEYKLLNVLIQGSAADCTKEAMIRYDSVREQGRLLLNVHDEIMVNSPREGWKREMKLLREAMESVEFDVPMLSDGKWGMSWGAMKKCA